MGPPFFFAEGYDRGSVTIRIAYFVSPHGFGHAARSAAVLSSLGARRPDIVPQIFSTVPAWFWEDSLGTSFDYHQVLTDIGLVQKSPIEEDPAATLRALERIRPLAAAAAELSRSLQRLECRLAICDISPLGLAAARLAGVPSILVESFTWDWIYRAYFEAEPGLRAVAEEMASYFDGADLRVQCEPITRPVSDARVVPPICRRARSTAGEVRARLGIDDELPIVLITMGGTSWPFGFLDRLQEAGELRFVAFAGTSESERRGNVLLLPDRSPVFVPDLIAAADLVVGKLGYSTVTEAWAGGTRYAFVPRPSFPEGESLATFVRERLPTLELERSRFVGGDWLDDITAVLGRPRPDRPEVNGADRVAEIVVARLEGA